MTLLVQKMLLGGSILNALYDCGNPANGYLKTGVNVDFEKIIQKHMQLQVL